MLIGEVAWFRLEFVAPQGTVAQMVFLDTLPPGLAYVPGSARLARIFDTSLTTSANPGGINAAPSSVFVPLADGVDVVVNGQDLSVTLGDVNNGDADANDERLQLDFYAVVQNIPDNQRGDGFINEAQLSFLDALAQPQSLDAAGPPMLLIEAALTTTKTATPSTLNSAFGGAVHFTITVTNPTGFFSAPAYDLEIFDSLPSGLENVANVVIAASSAVGITNSSTSNKVEVTIDSLAVGGLVIVDFDAYAPPPVPETIVNAVRTTWSSVPGSFGTGSNTPGSPGTALGERNTTNGYKVNGKATITAGSGPTATRTRAATNTPLPSGPTPTPTPTPPASGPTPSLGVPSATATATVPAGKMGARFVSVGRVNPESSVIYSVALVVYSRGTVPDVRAELQLPAEVEFVSANPAPTTAPQPGNSGLVYWELGDLTGPANAPLEVHARVRSDAIFGTQFVATLRIENGEGEVINLSRLSRVGRTDRARLSRERKATFIAKVSAPSRMRLGRPIGYRIKASSLLKEGFSSVVVRALLPATVQAGYMEPLPTVVDPAPDGKTLVEWRFDAPTRAASIKLYANVVQPLVPGDTVQTYIVISDGVGEKSVVVGTSISP